MKKLLSLLIVCACIIGLFTPTSTKAANIPNGTPFNIADVTDYTGFEDFPDDTLRYRTVKYAQLLPAHNMYEADIYYMYEDESVIAGKRDKYGAYLPFDIKQNSQYLFDLSAVTIDSNGNLDGKLTYYKTYRNYCIDGSIWNCISYPLIAKYVATYKNGKATKITVYDTIDENKTKNYSAQYSPIYSTKQYKVYTITAKNVYVTEHTETASAKIKEETTVDKELKVWLSNPDSNYALKLAQGIKFYEQSVKTFKKKSTELTDLKLFSKSDATVLSKPYKLSSSKVTAVKKYSTYSRIEVATADGTCTVLVDGKTKIKKGNTVDVYFVATNAQVEKSKVHVYGLAKTVTKSK